MEISEQILNRHHSTVFPVGDASPANSVAGVTSKRTGTFNASRAFNVACWNVRTLLDPASQLITMRSLLQYRVNICCLNEVRIAGTGTQLIKIPEQEAIYYLYKSGPTDSNGLHGVALALDSRANTALVSWEPISSRLAVARIHAKPVTITVICVYAPTLITVFDIKDVFYDELQKVVDRVPTRDILIIAGGWNARTGQANAGINRIIEKFGLGQRCENGERLLNFAAYNRLIIGTRDSSILKSIYSLGIQMMVVQTISSIIF